MDNATRARQARESLRPLTPDGNYALRVTPPQGGSFRNANYPTALGQPVQVVRIDAAVTASPTTPPAAVTTVTDNTQLATDVTFNQGNQFPLGDWLMVDVVLTTDPTTADLTIDADTRPTLNDLGNLIRRALGLSPRSDPALTPADIHHIGGAIDNARFTGAIEPSWADQHTPSTIPNTGIDTPPVDSDIDTDTAVDTDTDTDTDTDLDAIHNQHAEQTPAGVSHHRGDPTMGDLPHRVPADPNRFTADTHITPDGYARIGDHTLTPEQYGDLLRRSGWDGTTPVRLIGCDAATNGFAQRLAHNLGVDVLAPTQAAWTDSNGSIFSAAAVTNADGTRTPRIPPDGQWQTHHPNGTSTSAGPESHPSGTTTPKSIDSASAVDRARRVPSRSDSPARNSSPQQSAEWNPPTNDDGSPLPAVPMSVPPGTRVADLNGTPQMRPNSRMVVADTNGTPIGTFYTDANGNITHADLMSQNSGHTRQIGSVGSNPNISRPEPGVTYRVTDQVGGGVQTYRAVGRPESETPHAEPDASPNREDVPHNVSSTESAPADRFDAFHEGPIPPAVGWDPPGNEDGEYRVAEPITGYDTDTQGPFSLTQPREPHTRYDVYDTDGNWHGSFYTDADGRFSHIQTWSGNQDHGFNPELGTGATWDAAMEVPSPNTTFAVGPRHLEHHGLDPRQPRQLFRTDEHGDTVAATGIPTYAPPGTRAEDHFGPRRGLGGPTDLQTDVGNIAGGGRDRHGTYLPGEHDASLHPNQPPELYRFAGGHLIPYEAGGPGERINHVPQWAYENSGWKRDGRPTVDSWRRMESNQAALGRSSDADVVRVDVFSERVTPDVVTPDKLHARYLVRPAGNTDGELEVRSFDNVP
ncbi:hypothetical protein [Nocardia aurea]|uniref:DUF4237 domain-containing protein n=1 Tax=Nocardia aurea TaxID=2144174 RepID=A0ABV3FMQ0_9NOCA